MGDIFRRWMGQPSKERMQAERQQQLDLQQQNADIQQAAQQKQIEVQQNQQAAQEKEMAARMRRPRGARLLMAADTGFGGVKSKLG